MAQIIPLEIPLFKTIEEEETSTDNRKVIWQDETITMLEPTKNGVKNPCFDCWAKGLCDDGECGMKLFPIDE